MKPVKKLCMSAAPSRKNLPDGVETKARDYLKHCSTTVQDQSIRLVIAGRWVDLIMWDNRAVLHYAVHDHGDDPRLIQRLQIEGHVPE